MSEEEKNWLGKLAKPVAGPVIQNHAEFKCLYQYK